MLIERMAKAYAQIGLGILPDRANKILLSSISVFEAQQAELIRLAPSSEIKKNYELLSLSWSGYKARLRSSVSVEMGRKIYSQSDTLTDLANETVELLDNYLGTNTGALVNLSGRQRMITQGLAKHVFFKEWFSLTDNHINISNDTLEFISAASNIGNDLAMSDSVKLDLHLANTQWLFFQDAIQQGSSSLSTRLRMLDIANTSERLLEMYESITLTFQKAYK